MFGLFRKNLTGFAIESARETSRGGRDCNQDASGTAWTREGMFLAVVADGLGGHDGGEFASRLAVETVLKCTRKATLGLASTALPAAFHEAHGAILERAGRDSGKRQMKSTCVAALLAGGMLHFASVGDSRLYLLRRNRLERITKDHSVAQLMVDSGQLDEAAAAVHPDRNRLFQALGIEGELRVQASEEGIPLSSGDVLLLCSDGFWNYLDMQSAEAFQQRQETPIGKRLKALFLQTSAAASHDPRHDNMTALVVGVR